VCNYDLEAGRCRTGGSGDEEFKAIGEGTMVAVVVVVVLLLLMVMMMMLTTT
jgi:hypothetical protein